MKIAIGVVLFVSMISCISYRTDKNISSEEYKVNYEEEYDIDKIYFLDSSFVNHAKYISDSTHFKDILQPYQIMMFQNDSLIFHQANCFVPTSLTWTLGMDMDWQSSLRMHPPKMDSFRVMPHLKLSDLQSYVRDFDGDKIELLNSESYIIVLFSHYLPDFFDDLYNDLENYISENHLNTKIHYISVDKLYGYKIH